MNITYWNLTGHENVYEAGNVTGFIDLLRIDQAITGNMFGLGILLAIFMVAFITLSSYRTEQAFTAAMWITTISSIMFVPMGIISVQISMGMIAISLVALWVMSRFD